MIIPMPIPIVSGGATMSAHDIGYVIIFSLIVTFLYLLWGKVTIDIALKTDNTALGLFLFLLPILLLGIFLILQ